MKKILCFLLAVIIFPACGKKTEESKLNVYIDIKDSNTISVIRYLGDQYEKENSGTKINYMIPINEIDKEKQRIADGNVILTSRSDMINLSQSAQLMDMSDSYESLKLSKNYMNIVSSYGEYNYVNFGIGFLPRNIRIIYDKDFWDKNSLNDKNYLDTLKKALNICVNRNVKIPVVLDEDMDINYFIFSLISNQVLDTQSITHIYDSSKESYKNIQFDRAFKEIKNLYGSRILSKGVFYSGTENDFKNLNSGSIPFIITSKNYYNNYKDLKYVISETPVYYINSVISIPMENKNNWDAASFIKFLYSDKAAKLLSARDYVSGNIKYNKDTYKKVLPMFNLPEKFQKPVANKVNAVLGGTYNGNEWSEVLGQVK
ncbi:MAG: hypothetical protein WCQ54_11900 [Clostridiaceae bacterium]